MFTIRIKAMSTKKFVWYSSAQRGLIAHTTTTLHEAAVTAIRDFRDYVSGEGSQEGIHACLVTCQDGDDLRAFILHQDTEIPTELPWILMNSLPERVLRA